MLYSCCAFPSDIIKRRFSVAQRGLLPVLAPTDFLLSVVWRPAENHPRRQGSPAFTADGGSLADEGPPPGGKADRLHGVIPACLSSIGSCFAAKLMAEPSRTARPQSKVNENG